MKALDTEPNATETNEAPRAKTQHRARGRGNGEGSVYQRSDGTWCAAVPVANGKRRVLYGRIRQEVAQKLNTAQADMQKGVPLPAGRLTLAKYLDQWLEQAARPTLKATTFRSYQELVRLHIAPGLGRNTLAGLQPQQVQAFLNERSSTGLSPRRVQYIHAVLRVSLNRAVKWQLVHRNVALLAEPPRGAPAEI